MEFKIGDKVVYPNHGIGVIEEIKLNTSETNGSYYRLRILANDSTVMVPASNISQVGLRRVIARKELQKVYGILEDGQIAMHSNWKGRFQENSNRMRTGEILEVAAVLKNLSLLSQKKNLSYRERRVLELRYGLGGEHPRTLDEVGRTFNVTRERIRQIENQSLKKLQSLAEAQKLREVA